MQEIEAVLAEAVKHHHAGRLGAAEAGYRRILALDGRHADSLHLLGIIADQLGRHDEAIDLIARAIGSRDDVAAYHTNLGDILVRQGKPADAISCFERAVALTPDSADAHNNLARVLLGQARLTGAVRHYTRAIELKPDYLEA
jgi:protein O-GlcNAc transferase